MSNRTGSKPANCKFDSNSSWVSSSVNNGAARKEIDPRSALAAVAASGGSAEGGLTLKSEALHEATDNKIRTGPIRQICFNRLLETPSPVGRGPVRGAAARLLSTFSGFTLAPRPHPNPLPMGEGRSVGGGNDFGARAYPGADMMQLGGIDHVQALFTDALEAWQDFAHRSVHDFFTAFVSGEIKIEMLAHEPIRHACKTIERILDSVAEQLAPQHVIVQRNAQRKFHRRRGTLPEVQVVFPAGVEEFPLQVGHLDQLCALLLLHARVFERDEECRDKS